MLSVKRFKQIDFMCASLKIEKTQEIYHTIYCMSRMIYDNILIITINSAHIFDCQYGDQQFWKSKTTRFVG